MEEVTLLDFNRDRGGSRSWSRSIRKEGTFFSDNPFYRPRRRLGSARERAGAEAFERFLAERITPELAAESGFRPGRSRERAGRADHDRATAPIRPSPNAGSRCPRRGCWRRSARAWREDRKPANVMLVVDVSGSMADEQRLERAKDGLLSLPRADPAAGPSRPHRLRRPGRGAGADRRLRPQPRTPETDDPGLPPDGGTAFRDATAQAFERVGRRGRGGDRINAVVVLTRRRGHRLVAQPAKRRRRALLPRGLRDPGAGLHDRLLADRRGRGRSAEGIAEASGGQTYEGGTGNIELVYRSISSFF